jgi:hypothetical protein
VRVASRGQYRHASSPVMENSCPASPPPPPRRC